MIKTKLNGDGEGGNLYMPLDGRLWPINYETGESVSTVLSEVVACVAGAQRSCGTLF